MAAFQQLGPFISTFADADLTGMYVDEDGMLVFKPEEIQERYVWNNSVTSVFSWNDNTVLPYLIFLGCYFKLL